MNSCNCFFVFFYTRDRNVSREKHQTLTARTYISKLSKGLCCTSGTHLIQSQERPSHNFCHCGEEWDCHNFEPDSEFPCHTVLSNPPRTPNYPSHHPLQKINCKYCRFGNFKRILSECEMSKTPGIGITVLVGP